MDDVTLEFERGRDEIVSLIRELAPGRLHGELERLLCPAIGITATPADENTLPVGASKFFGDPDVPPNFQWPLWKGNLLGFVAQFDLSEVGPFDVEKVLPCTGVLSIFFDWQQLPTQTVFYFPKVERRLPPTEAPPRGFWNRLWEWLDSPQKPAPCCALTFSAEWTLPSWDAPQTRHWANEDWDDLEPLVEELLGLGHQLLGHPMPVQGGVEYYAAQMAGNFDWRKDEEAIESAAREWRLLFQMDSQMPDWLWGDLGKIYFLIRHDDLAARRFEQARVVFQCH